MLVLKKLHLFIYLFVRYLRHLRYINEQNKQKSFPSLILHTSRRKQTINKEQSKLTKEKHCKKKKSCVKRIGNTKWSWQILLNKDLKEVSQPWYLQQILEGKSILGNATRLSKGFKAKACLVWLKKKSQEVTEAGMEKAVRKSYGEWGQRGSRLVLVWVVG